MKKLPNKIIDINTEDVDQLFADLNELLPEFLALFVSDYQELFPDETRFPTIEQIKILHSLYNKYIKWIFGSPGDFISFVKNANTIFGIGFILPDYSLLSILLAPLRLIFYFPKLILSRAILWYLSLQNIYPYKIYEEKIIELKRYLKIFENKIDRLQESNKS